MRTLTIAVPALPPNLNKASRNWYAEHKRLKDFAELVRLCALSAKNEWECRPGATWTPLERASIEVQYVIPRSQRGPVPDSHNLTGALKKAIDRLTARPRGHGDDADVGVGIIQDDGDGLTWLAVPLVRRGAEEQTIITITERE